MNEWILLDELGRKLTEILEDLAPAKMDRNDQHFLILSTERKIVQAKQMVNSLKSRMMDKTV